MSPAPLSRRRFATLLCGALFFLAALAHAETLRLATYNVENYGMADRMTEAGYRKDYPKPEAAKRALRTVLRRIDADIVVLQEMGTRAHLEELRRDLKAEGLDYPHAELAEAADPDRHVALLSKRPLLRVATHAGLQFTYFKKKEPVKRGMLEATVQTEAGEVTLFAFHLKSRLTDVPEDPLSATRRAAEATAIRDLVLKKFPAPASAQFVLLGDCNDVKSSKALTFLQKRGNTAISEALPAADSRGESWTYVYRREETYSRPDYILVSPPLLPAVRGGISRIDDGPGVDDASDHRPVFVELVLSPRK